jgi:hypothetical protein
MAPICSAKGRVPLKNVPLQNRDAELISQWSGLMVAKDGVLSEGRVQRTVEMRVAKHHCTHKQIGDIQRTGSHT